MSPLLLQIFKIALTVLVLAWLGLALIALVFANSMIFPVPPPSYGRDANLHFLPLPDGTEAAAFIREAERAGQRWMLYFHGNGEDLGQIGPWLNEYVRRGWSVLAIDYPGYGRSGGLPSEKGCFWAADAAYRYLTTLREVPPQNIYLYGRSVGSGPALYLAEKYPAAGLILEAPFLSAFRVVTRVRLLPWDVFDNAARAPRVQIPVLLLHGRKDQVVPFWHGEKLLSLFPGPKSHLWLDLAGHNDISDFGDVYWQALEKFVADSVR